MCAFCQLKPLRLPGYGFSHLRAVEIWSRISETEKQLFRKDDIDVV